MKRTESHLVKKFSEDVHYLENENEMMWVQLEEILNEKEISTFEGGRYRDEVREVCYSLLARGVSTRDMELIIRTILKKLGNVNIGKLPKKSVVSNMMIECDQLAKIQVGTQYLQEPIIHCILMEHISDLMNTLPFKKQQVMDRACLWDSKICQLDLQMTI